MTNGSLMKVGEWSILQILFTAFGDNRSWKPVLVFLSDRLRQVLLYYTFQRVNTVNSEIFPIILFSRIALKDIIFATFKKLWLGHDFLISVKDSDFAICDGFIFTKFRENKTIAKISEFTVTKALIRSDSVDVFLLFVCNKVRFSHIRNHIIS